MSGETWYAFCDWHCVEGEKFNPRKVQKGDTVFVEYNKLKEFKHKILPLITHKFILISSNFGTGADNPLPGKFINLLEDKNIAAWFVQNIDRQPSEKIIPIPIGLANKEYPHGNIETWDFYIQNRDLIYPERDTLAYVNFFVATNPKERMPCLSYFSQMPWATIACTKQFSNYLDDLARSIFVVSPFGHGLDCHRTWEALLMGCYPIVKHSTLHPLFEGLPVVYVNKWEEVTEEFLLEKYKELRSTNWKVDKLYAHYWFNKIKALQQELRKSNN